MKPVYLLSGDSLLADEALEKVRAEADTDPLSEASFDAGAGAHEIVSALTTSSLLGGRRLVVVRDAGSLKKDQTDALISYLESPNPDSVLVLVGSIRGRLAAAAKATGGVVKLEPPKGRGLAAWIRERGRAHNVNIDDRGAWALIDAVGNELRDLDGALSQLRTGAEEGARLSQADVRRAFPRLADQRIYAFTDAVGERQLAAAMGSLRRLLEQGDEPLMLFGALTSQIRRMLTAVRAAEQGPKAVGEALGLPDWRAERLYRQIRSYREEELATAMGVLAATDVEMKGGDIPPEAALERAVIEIVSS